MKKTLLALAITQVIARIRTKYQHTQDNNSILYRMGAGFPGDVNRTHPFSVTPGLIHQTTPPRLYGDPVLLDTATNSFRGFAVGDTGITTIDGIAVRPYPTQQTTGGMTATIGTAVPTLYQPLDVLEDGYGIVKVNGATAPTKKGAVFVWIAASTGAHVQGGFEAAATGGSTVAITNAVFNGPPDANGITEIRLRALL